MSEDPVKMALDALFAKHRAIDAERYILRFQIEELESEDAKLQQKIVALAQALDQEPDPQSPLGMFLAEIAASGLTDGVRTVLRATDLCRTPTEIRDGLLRLGYDLSGYSNILASIHTILGRLRESGEVEKVTSSRKGGKETGYIWKIDAKEKEKSDLAKEVKKDLDYLRTEKAVDPLSKRY
ncbi:MAG: hypothetical protein ACR2LM_05180 [Pyrinomonadaceae bacterium]